ncbi:hypothetical protein GCM10010361_22290 [Streptomyces olivaceiscleroticus]|uniref:Uncharacterized protein n=1 Tax=Streptomyces olivaceiscleroticus TaxID=68245 RepID=A0ABN0ZSU6_9ACTN
MAPPGRAAVYGGGPEGSRKRAETGPEAVPGHRPGNRRGVLDSPSTPSHSRHTATAVRPGPGAAPATTTKGPRAMPRLLAATLTCIAAAALAAGAGLGAVAVLNATPEQPNVPLVTFDRTGE